MEKKFLTDIFLNGIENAGYIAGTSNSKSRLEAFVRTLRLTIWYPFANVPLKHISSDSVKLIYAPLHQVILKDENGESILVCYNPRGYGKDIPRFSNYVAYRSLLKFALTIPSDIKKSKLLYDWLFFKVLNQFLLNVAPKRVTVAGIYDCITTWIAYLCKYHNIELQISQHGICAPYDLPHKIPVNRVKVFCEAERRIFDTIVSDPENVKYSIKGYRSSVSFVKGNFVRPTIAVASQPGYEKDVVYIIQSIFRNTAGYDVIIYAHPRDVFRTKGNVLIDNKNVEIVDSQRFNDICALVVINSTLAYDYLACEEFRGMIFSYHIDNQNLSVYRNESITLIEPDVFGEEIHKYLSR